MVGRMVCHFQSKHIMLVKLPLLLVCFHTRSPGGGIVGSQGECRDICQLVGWLVSQSRKAVRRTEKNGVNKAFTNFQCIGNAKQLSNCIFMTGLSWD